MIIIKILPKINYKRCDSNGLWFTPINLISGKGHLAIMKKTQFIAFGSATLMSVQALPTVAFAAEPSINSSYSIDSQTTPIFSQTDVYNPIPIFVGATMVSEKLSGSLVALGEVLATINGVVGIKEHCFNWKYGIYYNTSKSNYSHFCFYYPHID